jgi:hypothetical protein
MFAFDIFGELTGKGAAAVFGIIVGTAVTWMIARWRRMQDRASILRGDARDTVVIHQHLVETAEVPAAGGVGKTRIPKSLRMRSVGQGQLRHVVPNGHLASVLRERSLKATPLDTLISMDGAEGSFLLETLTNFVCDRVANSPFDHDLYVMAPCCEPVGLAEHQPITILLVSVSDLALFENWNNCRDIEVEHGSDGARVLTLMELSKRYLAEQKELARLRQAGQRTRYVETMYVLDLALDKRSAPFSIKKTNWGRFEEVLKLKNLE